MAMINNPCVQILSRISPAELKEIEAFFRKRLDGTQELVLFQHLYACYPHYNEDNTAPALLSSVLTKEKTKEKSVNTLGTIANRLHKALQEYLIDHALKVNPLEKDLLLAYEYGRLGLTDLRDKRVDNVQQASNWEEAPANSNSSNVNVWYPWYLYRLYHLKYYSGDTIKIALPEENLVKSLECLELAYQQGRLRIAIEMASLQNITSKIPTIELSIEELKGYQKRELSTNPFLPLSAKAYELVKYREVAKYYELKDLLKQWGNYLSKDEHGNLLGPLINFASHAIRNGHLDFYHEAIELHLYGLNNGVLLQDGKITPEILLNLINTSYEAGHLESTAGELKKWEGFLPHSIKKEAMCTLNARVFFFSKAYPEAVNELSKVKSFKNHILELSIRTTVAQSYYEHEDFMALSPFLLSFAKTLGRHEDRFSSEHRGGYGNFIKMLQAIYVARFNANTNWKGKKHRLLQKAEKMGPIACKKWILEKINQLSK